MKKIALVFISIALSLLLLEFGLRPFDYHPGVYDTNQGITPVDSLVLFQNFTTDEMGIYKFSPWVIDSFPKYADKEKGIVQHKKVAQALAQVDNIDCVHFDFMKITEPNCCENLKLSIKCKRFFNDQNSELNIAYQQLSSATDGAWKNAVSDYVRHPYNKEGFRSIAFEKHNTSKKRVLIIGDSFVYGMSSIPFHKSFTDNLLARGIMVYAAGIPGTDPAQYAAIAQKYLPILQPDLVIICFYEGNDYMMTYRTPSALEPHEHITNAGFFQSNPLGEYLDAHEAYQYYLSLMKVPEQSAFFFTHSVIGALIWKVLYNFKWVTHPIVQQQEEKLQLLYATNPQSKITHHYLAQIDSVAQHYHIPVKFIIIPDNGLPHNEGKEICTIDTLLANAAFQNIPYDFPKNLHRKNHYSSSDYHFNNAGSKIFADYLEGIIYE